MICLAFCKSKFLFSILTVKMNLLTYTAAFLGIALTVLASPAPNAEPQPTLAPQPNKVKRFATNVFPASSGHSVLSAVHTVAAGTSFDGKMYRYDRGVSCVDGEGGDSDAVFMVASGATLKNVIIGANQLEGVHCSGPCTIQNVWWADVCEGWHSTSSSIIFPQSLKPNQN
jgi:hypothetical protein